MTLTKNESDENFADISVAFQSHKAQVTKNQQLLPFDYSTCQPPVVQPDFKLYHSFPGWLDTWFHSD